MKRYEVLKPSCYGRFSCKGGDCRINCCSEWSITLSKEEYRETKKRKPEAENLIRCFKNSTGSDDRGYEMILKEDGSCPFLTDDRLCSLQVQFGPSILSFTCSEFPRTHHKYLNKLQGGLSMGCERVLELLLEEKGHLQLSNIMKRFPDGHRFGSTVDEKKRKKYPALLYYYDIQNLCLSLIQAEEVSLEDRMILLGVALYHIDELVKEENARAIPDYIVSFLQGIEEIDVVGQLNRVDGSSIGVLFSNMLLAKSVVGVDDPHYEALIEKISDKLQVKITPAESQEEKEQMKGNMQCSKEVYQTCKENYARFMTGKEYFLENIIVAWMFQQNTPFAEPENGVWKDYTYMVWGFCMIKFALTVTLTEESTEEDMIDCCVTMFRKIGHSKMLYKNILKQFEENESSTVAHMAVYLKS